MTDAERDERKALAAQRRKEAAARKARKLRLDNERKFHSRVQRMYGRIDPEIQRILEYIHRQIMSPREDIGGLEKTRDHHLRPYLPKGVN